MNEKEKVYSIEDVNEAIRITALGVARILSRQDAEETLNKLPNSLASCVMTSTIAAHKTREMAEKLLKMMPKGSAKPEESEKKKATDMTKEEAIDIARKHNKVPEVAAFMILGDMSPKDALIKAGIEL